MAHDTGLLFPIPDLHLPMQNTSVNSVVMETEPDTRRNKLINNWLYFQEFGCVEQCEFTWKSAKCVAN